MADNTTTIKYHKDYLGALTKWQKCRDVLAGEDVIKARGETYLPRLGGQDDKRYKAYVMRSRFFPAFSKTLVSFLGLMTRTDPAIRLPDSDAAKEAIRDVTSGGVDIQSFIQDTIKEILAVGRVGTLLEYTQLPDGVTAAQARQIGARAYLTRFLAEDILNWKYDKGRLVYVLLREEPEDNRVILPDGNAPGTDYVYRELLINEDGVYQQRVFIEHDGQQLDIAVFVPRRDSKPFDFIPFWIHQAGRDQNIVDPPLYDLANLNLAHYRLKADHNHALHFVALPTPYATGVDPTDDNAPSEIGPEALWLLPNEASKVGMLEFTGAGVGAIQKELEAIEEQMAQLGTRVLMTESGEKTATATRIRSMSETASLASILGIINSQFTQILREYLAWQQVPEPDSASITYAKNLLPADLKPADVLSLFKAHLEGAYDYDTFIEMLQRAEYISRDADPEDLKAKSPRREFTPEQQRVLAELYIKGVISLETLLKNYEEAGLFPDGWTWEDEYQLLQEQGPTDFPNVQ